MIQRIREAGWNPAAGAGWEGFKELIRLAERCEGAGPSLGRLALPGPTLKGHKEDVSCLAISPDGQVLASGGRTSLRLWHLPDGRALATLEDVAASANYLAFTSDGQVLVSRTWNSPIRLWSLPEGHALATLRDQPFWIAYPAISPDGQVLASGSGDGTVRLWRLPDGHALATLQDHIHVNGRLHLAFSPDGQVLASRGRDGLIQLWHLPDGQALAMLQGHTKAVNSLAITPDGQVLASRHSDGIVHLWRLSDGQALATLQGHTTVVSSLAITPDGQVLASGSWDGTVRLWTSELVRLSYLPIEQMSVEDLAWTRKMLQDGDLSRDEHSWLEFIAALMRWRRCFEIQLDETPRYIEVGEFDIELEG